MATRRTRANISRPDAGGQIRAMRAALADAKLGAGAVGYVNAHGTATPVGDVVETDAIKQAFGAHAARCACRRPRRCTGISSAAPARWRWSIAIMALARGVVPPTAHLDQPDPACDLDYVPNRRAPGALDAVMSNSFGFGGMNAVLIARRY